MQSLSSKYYPLKVWFAVVAIAPLLQELFILFYQGATYFFEPFQAYFFLVILTAIISAPSLAIYYLASKALEKLQIVSVLAKWILSAFAVVLFYSTKTLLDDLFVRDFYHPKNLAFIINYSLIIVIAGLYFSYPAKELPITVATQKQDRRI